MSPPESSRQLIRSCELRRPNQVPIGSITFCPVLPCLEGLGQGADPCKLHFLGSLANSFRVNLAHGSSCWEIMRQAERAGLSSPPLASDSVAAGAHVSPLCKVPPGSPFHGDSAWSAGTATVAPCCPPISGSPNLPVCPLSSPGSHVSPAPFHIPTGELSARLDLAVVLFAVLCIP